MLSAKLTEAKCVCHTSPPRLTPVIIHFSVKEEQLPSVDLRRKKNN